jgi:hypothetical protein
MTDSESKPASPEFTIDARLRKLIAEQNVLTDTYKMALGTIVEQRSCIEDWQRRSAEWCSKCDKANALTAEVRRLRELLSQARQVLLPADSCAACAFRLQERMLGDSGPLCCKACKTFILLRSLLEVTA